MKMVILVSKLLIVTTKFNIDMLHSNKMQITWLHHNSL